MLRELMEQTESFLRVSGHKGYPYLRFYLRVWINECLKHHTKEEVDAAITEGCDRVAAELGIDCWLS